MPLYGEYDLNHGRVLYDMPRALFLTAVAADRFSRQASGIQRRFELLVTGVSKIFDAIDFVVMIEKADVNILRERKEKIRHQLSILIPVKLSVKLIPVAAPPKDGGCLQSLMTQTLLFDRMPGYRNYLGSHQLESLRACLNEHPPAAIFSQRLATMAMLTRIARSVSLPTIFFDLDDLEHVSLHRSAAELLSWKSRWFHYFQLPALIAEERRAIALAQRSFVCSDIDLRKLARLAMADRVMVLPNSVDIPNAFTPPARAPMLLFVGIFSYDPNSAAAEYFIDTIWPRIRAQVPDACVIFAGAHPEHVSHYREPPPGVAFPGFVRDLSDLYADARVVVCPIRTGGGTRVKIIEAAAYARPVVSTTLGAEGLGFENGAEILLRDDDKGFAEACIELLSDYSACVRIGRAARARACLTHQREAVATALAEIIQETAKFRSH